ncbi:MAG: hypothetical protein LBQ44_10230, partial [Treponema sp.]|nr:hypothetical protein [Treponema sp.]
IFAGLPALVFAFGLVLASCNGGGPGNVPADLSYSYSAGSIGSDVYVMTITKPNPAAAGIYPSLGRGLAVLADGETAVYTLRLNGVIKSTGQVLMGPVIATFTPANGATPFSGTLSDAALLGLTISADDDGNPLPIPVPDLGAVSEEEGAFAAYWGTWRSIINGVLVELEITDGYWVFDIVAIGDHAVGTYTQRSATRVDVFQTNNGMNGAQIGHVVTGDNTSMTITLYSNTSYPGTYTLTR